MTLVVLLPLAGCLSPREQPRVTQMIRIRGGSFSMGGGGTSSKAGGVDARRCEGDDRYQRCESMEDTPTPSAWIEHLTWLPKVTVPSLDAFDIDAHEVTNAQYQLCVDLGECSEPASTEVDGEDYYGDPDYGRHPVVNVSRAQAQHYCEWIGRTLPTEAQWERAARLGPHPKYEKRMFPWGGTTASGCTAGEARYAVTRSCADLPPAVDYSEGDLTAHKVRNMASNVAEWVRDDWSLWGYCAGGKPYDNACRIKGDRCTRCIKDGDDCIKSCQAGSLVLCKNGGTYKPVLTSDQTNPGVIRGGDWVHDKCYHRLYVRRKGEGAKPFVGFRCARATKLR